MTILNLPKLRPDHQVKPSAERGRWSDPDGLEALADAIHLEAQEADLRGIKSVPHTWGHIIMFESALLGKEHSGHKDARGQWRALLTMLALRKFKKYALRAESVDRGHDEDGRAGSDFTELVFREKRPPGLHEEGGWEPLRLLYASVLERPDVLVGLLSPSTIVAPARDFAGDGDVRQFWARDGLRDPLDSDDPQLSPGEIEVCRLYVQDLAGTVRTLSPAGRSADALAGLLDDFDRDLDGSLRGRRSLKAWIPREGEDDLVPGATDAVYKAVNKSWIEDDRSPKNADLVLTEIPLQGGAGDDGDVTIRVVLADPEVAGTLGTGAENVSLFGDWTLADLKAAADGSGTAITKPMREDADKNNILLVEPGDLLTDRLTTLREFEAEASEEQFRDMLLPVKPATLLLFEDLDDLRRNLRLWGATPRDRRASLTVTVERPDGSKERHRVTRSYAGEEAALSAYPPWALAAWPGFRGPKWWKWNFLFGSSSLSPSPRERSIVLTTGVSREILRKDLQEESNCAELRARLARWGSAEGPWPDASGAARSGNARWSDWLRMRRSGRHPDEKILQRCDTPFEAVLFRLPSDRHPDGVYAGVGTLPPPREGREQQEAAGGKAKVACDFGTSNTIVYWKPGSGAARRLAFKPQLRRFNQYRKKGGVYADTADTNDHYVEFMPAHEIEHPFTTVMQIRNAAGVPDFMGKWLEADSPALWRDYAFFDPEVANLTERLLSEGSGGHLVFDLKWEDDEKADKETRARMVRFLRHVTMLSLAEVLNRDEPPETVQWHFSYPISMPNAESYKKEIEDKALSDGERKHEVLFHTESHATLEYFIGFGEMKEKPTAILALDIGGGSTDMALWTRERNHVWQHSVRLAGDDLMTEFLLHNRQFLAHLDIDGVGGRRGVFGDKDSRSAFMEPKSDQKPSGIERNAARAIISSRAFREELSEKWSYIIDTTDEGRRLKAGASVMASGLCWFLRWQIRALVERGRGSGDLSEGDLQTVGLCFGGLGSSLFKLWGEKEEKALKPLASSLTEYDGVRADDRLQLYFSADMKHEAAKGMLAGTGGGDFRLSDCGRVLGIGAEGGTASGGALDATTLLSEASGNGGGSDVRVAWTGFEDFLQSLGRQSGFEIGLKYAAEVAIRTRGEEELKRILDEEGAREPPFIAMVRETMRLIYQGDAVTVSKLD